jgi:hypothetical protein
LNKDEKIEVVQMFKPNQSARSIFNQIDYEFKPSEYYDWKYCNNILLSYLKLKDLFIKGSGEIQINEELFKICKYNKYNKYNKFNNFLI